MTPQLQQAIKLLQLSTLDLQQEIQSALESNPLLEVPEEAVTSEQSKDSAEAGKEAEPSNSDSGINGEGESANNEDFQDSGLTATDQTDWENTIPEDLPVDTKWDEVYTNLNSSNSTSSNSRDFNEAPDLDARNSATESLKDHLMWQLNLTPMSDVDQLIAETIIDALDRNGILTTSPDEMVESFHPDLEIEIEEVEAVRHRLQLFDPVGVASKNLQDCLMIQLAQLPSSTPWREQAALIIHRHLQLLANRDYAQLMRRTRLKEPQLKEVVDLIKSLNPQPGEAFQENSAQYIAPDVYVEKVKGRWTVELNPDTSPNIQINSHYASLIKRADSSEQNTFLKDNLQEAKWFLKSLHSRNETLLKVATKIVEHQKGFLEHGEEAMKPLVLADIAADVEMHESTVSRVTTQKFMHTPRGIFELKYFFSSHVSTTEGGECSSTAIRAIIKKLVAAENPKKPLSDNKIATLLGDQGIKVARRTIAKYRESLSIPPSNERKQLG